ncbi:hypothetical protein [Salinisphaera sp.]|uniref:hypothetical protein n=1 Tax=Salinisphaera sp. TaxID=1914330 RepID=UPI000C4AD9BE|nr:hypothetical protein [Salinisphaera sp.]MBS63423.1 hypothetical protein [Salinisphaera sp.]
MTRPSLGLWILGLFAVSAAAPAFAACSPGVHDYAIDATRLDSALQQFAHTSGCFVETDLGGDAGLLANGVEGRFTAANALIRLVRGTGLEAHFDHGHYAVNRADREAVKQRVDTLRSQVVSARENGALSQGEAEALDRELAAVWRDAQTLISEQGFLSAAENASFQRLFAYVQGQLGG